MSPFDPKKKGEDFNREDSNRSESSGYARFAKDKRARKTVTERVERTPRDRSGQEAGRPEHYRDIHATEQAPRRSYNPNFDRENRPAGGSKPYEHRDSGPSRERKGYDKPYAPRDSKAAYGPKGERKPFDKPYGEKSYGSKPYGEKKTYGERKPFDKSYGEKPYGERKPFDKPYGEKPYGERKPFSKPYGEKSAGRDEPRKSYRTEGGGYGAKRPGAPKAAAPKYDKENYPRFQAAPSNEPVRLNRFVAMSGICSRREADTLIQSGAVLVNGEPVTELGVKILPTDEVRYNGQVIQGEKKVYIVMNKPRGYVTSLDDPHAEKTVMELLQGACTERVYPVGRLDKNSVGVLLFTNDGDLTKRLTHPSHDKKKIYQVSLDKPVTHADMERIMRGVELEDGIIAADAVEYASENRKEVGIEIHSGRNRIVRRLFEALGYQVGKLDRVYFAGLTKKKLKRGQWRFLTPKEVGVLKSGAYE